MESPCATQINLKAYFDGFPIYLDWKFKTFLIIFQSGNIVSNFCLRKSCYGVKVVAVW